MNRKQWIAVGLLLAVALFIAQLALRNHRPPFMPNNADHDWQGAESCFTCHASGMVHERSKNHPIGLDCMRCHMKDR
jgi:hypothetical protein